MKPVSVSGNGNVIKPNALTVRRNGHRDLNRLTSIMLIIMRKVTVTKPVSVCVIR
jgi:hypothetical protein